MQTTLLGLAIAFIIALVAALIGPYFIDWNQFRPQFEAEATRVIGAQVRVAGKLDARLLPAPSLQLRSVVVGGANDLGKVRADKLDVEFSLGSLMRGEWRATELTINGMALDLGLDSQGRIDWPASTGKVQSGIAGDRPAEPDRPHRAARRLKPRHARAERYRLQRRCALAGRIGARRRQFHAVRDALSVSGVVRPDRRRQRHPRSSQHRSRGAGIVGRSRRRARRSRRGRRASKAR